MANLIENIKAKIEAAKEKMRGNADGRYNENLKKEIESHIAEMNKLLEKVEKAGANADTEYKQEVNDAIEKLDKMVM